MTIRKLISLVVGTLRREHSPTPQKMSLRFRKELLPVIVAFRNIENAIPEESWSCSTIQKEGSKQTDITKKQKLQTRRKMTAATAPVPTVIAKENRPDDIKLSNKLTRDGVKVECRICHRSFKLSIFSSHIMNVHLLSLSEFQRYYGIFYDHIKPEQRTYHECQLCGDFVLLDMGELDKHIKKAGHTIKNSEYIKQYCEEDKKGSKRKGKKPLSEPESKVVKITNPTVSVAVTVSDGPKLEGKQLE